MPTTGRIERVATGRAVEAGVTEGEDPAVGGHLPVAAAVGGGGDADDRLVEVAGRRSSRRTRRHRRRRSRRRRPPPSSRGPWGVAAMPTTGLLSTTPAPVGAAADAGLPAESIVDSAVAEAAAAPIERRRRRRRRRTELVVWAAEALVRVNGAERRARVACTRNCGMRNARRGDLSSVGQSHVIGRRRSDSLLVGWTPHLCIHAPTEHREGWIGLASRAGCASGLTSVLRWW